MMNRFKSTFLTVFLIVAVSCDREIPFELAPPSLIVLNDGMPETIQEPGKEVLMEFNLQAASGLSIFEVLQDGQSFDRVAYTAGEISSQYQFTYTIPSDQEIGSAILFNFELTDNENRKVEYTFNVKVNTTFSEIEDNINGTPVVKIKGRLNSDYILEASKNYLIDSILSIESNSTFTIEKGSTVYLRSDPDPNLLSRLVITRGSKIVADGTAEEPIVFTSDKVLLGEEPQPDDWGGIFIFGRAPSNQGDNIPEIGFRYGGNLPNDNSGSLTFVRVEYAGKDGDHALHFFGVGSNTLVENVQVFKNENNAFRVKGGRVSFKYIGAIGHGGYGIWAEDGWQGRGQFWIFQTDRRATLVPVNFWNQARSIEMRSDEPFFLTEPRTNFTISNVTLIGNGYEPGVENGTRRGIRIRRGANGILQNAIVTQFPDEGVRVEDLDISELGDTMILGNTRSYTNETDYEQEAESFFQNDAQFNVNTDPVPGISLGNFVGSEASTFNPISLDNWFESAPYIGAIESAANDWTTNGNWFKNLDGTIR